MGTPLVSVCMTAFNHEPYLAEAIEGVLMQRTTFGVELVLGEDCSTDRTPELCRAYAERFPDRIRLVTGPENVGWRANYRRTVAACKGRYVAFCDGDDRWTDPMKLQLQTQLLEDDPDCGMCYTCTEKYAADCERREYLPSGAASTDFRSLLRNYTIGNCTAMARRELLERYYAEVRPESHPEWLTGDVPMWLWVAAHTRIAYLDRVTAMHRVLPRSVSHDPDYRRRIAFCDSVAQIGLWFDARYGGGRDRWRLVRRRYRTALWVLSWYGPLRAYWDRWSAEVRAHPRLLFDATGYGLFVKKLLFRRNPIKIRNHDDETTV